MDTIISCENTIAICMWLATVRAAWFRWGTTAVPWHTVITHWGADILHHEEVMN